MRRNKILAGIMTSVMLLSMSSVSAFAAEDSTFEAAKVIGGVDNPLYAGEGFWLEGDLLTSDIRGIQLNKTYSSYTTRDTDIPCIYKFTVAEKTLVKITVKTPYASDFTKEDDGLYWGITNNADYVYSRESSADEMLEYWAKAKGKQYSDAGTITLNAGTYYVAVKSDGKHTVKVATTKADSAGAQSINTKYMPSFQLKAGEKITLQASSTGTEKAKYSTSNKKIATVSSKGVITAKAKGTCYITARQGDTVYRYKIKVTTGSAPSTEEPTKPEENIHKPADYLKTGGKVLNIWSWNGALQEYITTYYPDCKRADNSYSWYVGDTKVVFTVNPSYDNEYQIMLDDNLVHGSSNDADSRVDMFIIEPAYADKYVNSAYTLSVNDLGITEDELQDMYLFTKQIGTNAKGALKAITWQAYPGAFVFREDIAKKVFGTTEVDDIAQMLRTEDGRMQMGAKLKAQGYQLYVSLEDSFNAAKVQRSVPWVDDTNCIVIGPELEAWVKEMKTMYTKGYIGDAAMWSSSWETEQNAQTGKTFGFYYPGWAIESTLRGYNSDVSEDNWAVCGTPYNYYMGGNLICVSSDTDNADIAADIIRTLCLNEDVLTSMAKAPSYSKDWVNSMRVNTLLSLNKDETSEFLHQNIYDVLHEEGTQVDCSVISPYDTILNEVFIDAMSDYIKGNVGYEDALDVFYSNAIVKLPSLTKK